MFPDLATYPMPGLLVSFAIALVVSLIGFRRSDWFVSVAYGLSIAAQAAIFPLLLWGRFDLWAGLQALLLIAYGLRLATHIVTRERRPSYAKQRAASKERSTGLKGWIKPVMWVSVAILYLLMYSPALLTLNAQASGVVMASLPIGLVVMLVGLGMEALADWQKSAFKAKHPDDFVATGLYRLVRCPNYLGEMLFWVGLWISGISAYAGVLDWVLATLGIALIQMVMLGSAKRLESMQNQRYGARADYQAYIKRVPILFPFVPVYTLNKG